MIDVYISASNGGEGEADWYGILGVDPLADEETVNKQYKKLSLLIHPDKNKFKGAGDAFKLVSNAKSLLSDKAKRSVYDRKRKFKEVKQEKSGMQPNPHKPASSSTFWAAADSAKKAKEFQERWKRWFESQEKVARGNTNEAERLFKKPMGTTTTNSTFKATADSTSEGERLFKNSMPSWNATSTSEAERLFKKPIPSGDATSTSEAERLFKMPMTSGYANSTFEAERLFKNPMTSGYASSTFEAQRLFKKPMFRC